VINVDYTTIWSVISRARRTSQRDADRQNIQIPDMPAAY
jgi:hypothetical protein